MLKKLRIKFICINMALITIMLAVIFCLVIHFTRSSLEQSSRQMLQEIAADPLYLARPGDTSQIRLPYFTLRLDNRNRPLEVAGSYSQLSSEEDYLQKLIHLSLSAREPSGLLPDYNLRFLRFSTPADDFLIFMDVSTEFATMDTLTRNCLLIGIFSFFAFLGICIFLANWAVRPVDQAWNQQKQFIADASHELKTPLAVILTNTELLNSPSFSAEKKEHFLSNIRTMAGQMQKLVEGMLELSRIDSGSLQTPMEKLDFSSLTDESLYPFEPLYFENGRELDTEIIPDIQVTGNPSQLRQLLEILLDNALKYSSAGSSVSIRLKKYIVPACCRFKVMAKHCQRKNWNIFFSVFTGQTAAGAGTEATVSVFPSQKKSSKSIMEKSGRKAGTVSILFVCG